MGEGRHWLEATRHEDSLQKGIADVSFVSLNGNHGWIELKKLPDWPVRDGTLVTIDHYTDDQRIWLRRKGRAGGFVFLLLQVSRDYLLFDWKRAAGVGKLTKMNLFNICQNSWQGRMNYEELGQELCRGRFYEEG